MNEIEDFHRRELATSTALALAAIQSADEKDNGVREKVLETLSRPVKMAGEEEKTRTESGYISMFDVMPVNVKTAIIRN
jgi:hypothetical protein